MAYLGAYWTVNQLWVLLVRGFVKVVIPLSLIVFTDHIRHVLTYIWLKTKQHLGGQRPQDNCQTKPLPSLYDGKAYPGVAIQLPIFNERAVCQALIDYACNLRWPTEHLRVQVLDDSTDARTRQLVDDKVLEWTEKGVRIDVLRRNNRSGYKAGALKQGLELLVDCEYVAVFDADFRPEKDFLLQTIPYLQGDPKVSYVQTRWIFANSDESWLTQAQEVALNHHFKCEQHVHFAEGSFFNFNGTAGVWRKKAIEHVGGWSSRTTVEDMDLSLRTYLAGWKAVYLDDVTSTSELPASLFAYRKQQHRWTTGPVQLMIKILPDVWRSPLPLLRKLELLFSFFLVRKFLTHVLCLSFYCVLLPISVLTPQIHIPTWALLHIPILVTLSTCMFTPGGVTFSITYVLFQNAMALVKAWAVVAGVLGLKHANEWVVTTKLGRGKASNTDAAGKVDLEIPQCRMYPAELGMAAMMSMSAAVGVYTGHHYGINAFLLLQGLTFMSFGLNMVDCRHYPATPVSSGKLLGFKQLFGKQLV